MYTFRCSVLAPFALSGCLAALPGTALAQQRGYDAHVHGEGVAYVVAERETLAIRLEVPAVNAVGFEHHPSNEAQRQQVEELLERLRDGARWFSPAADAGCVLRHYGSSLGRMRLDSDGSSQASHSGDEEAHSHEEHAEGKDAHGHEEHAESKEGHGREAHADLIADYTFECARPEALTTLQSRILEALPLLPLLEVRIVTDRHQSVARITASPASVRLQP